MNNVIQNLIGLGGMSDQVIATDLLTSVKSGIKMLSFAVTEAATDEVRAALTQQLHNAIDFHGQITDFMIEKGYYHPYQLQEQLNTDMQAAQTALKLPLP
ncbi:spore coat protein [Heyndrickxia acidiproducens]|uniref:spore coat protein n=1 Tax=Heyndrickxia acidiproducens TaxID=1121084 RepID=UPI0003742800|nr:spore coat protein [Heyndrickxia acidiproducens]